MQRITIPVHNFAEFFVSAISDGHTNTSQWLSGQLHRNHVKVSKSDLFNPLYQNVDSMKQEVN